MTLSMSGPSVFLLDGYIDEPSALGVPPYLSPHARYIAGAAWDLDCRLDYRTVDQWRTDPETRNAMEMADLLVVLSGALVPGKYLRGTPVSLRELEDIGSASVSKVLGGPVAQSSSLRERLAKLEGSYDRIVGGDLDAGVHDLITSGDARGRRRNPDEWGRWSIRGADLVSMHPDFPLPLTVEVETSRGCVRYICGGCSFCTEPEFGRPVFRSPMEVGREVEAIYKNGVRSIRLGGQSCIFSYGTRDLGNSSTPRPDPRAVSDLFEEVNRVAPDLRMLHVDNANPAIISKYPDESRQIAKTLVERCTSGNVVALGMESADPSVKEANNLNSTPEQVMDAVKLLNEIGGERGPSGLPNLLPGINIVMGLEGESKDTPRLNMEFFQEVDRRGLMLRRINIRQVIPHRRPFGGGISHSEFIKFKKRVREEIDGPMLKRVVPEGTVLRNVYLEVFRDGLSLGRQLGSYPLLVALPYPTGLDRFTDVWITDHGYRSLTAVEHPFPINTAGLKALQALPGVGKKRAARLVRGRPFDGFAKFLEALDDPLVGTSLRGHLDLNGSGSSP